MRTTSVLHVRNSTKVLQYSVLRAPYSVLQGNGPRVPGDRRHLRQLKQRRVVSTMGLGLLQGAFRICFLPVAGRHVSGASTAPFSCIPYK